MNYQSLQISLPKQLSKMASGANRVDDSSKPTQSCSVSQTKQRKSFNINTYM